MLRVIVERFHPEKIILFGSQAHGKPDEYSDVDLLTVRREITAEKWSNVGAGELIEWIKESLPQHFPSGNS